MTSNRVNISLHARLVTFVGVLLLLSPAPAPAQQGNEPIYQQLADMSKRDYLSLGVLLQTVADFQIDRTFSGTMASTSRTSGSRFQESWTNSLGT
jgi:hypothetical protein